MVNLVDLVSELFSAYGREPVEEQIRAYVAVFRAGNPDAIARAIIEATTGDHERLPTAAQIMRRAKEVTKYLAEEGQRNAVRYNELRAQYLKKAAKAGWSLPQRDELAELFDTAISSEGRIRWNEERLRQEVSQLVYAVDDYRRRCEAAKINGEEVPDEKKERWAWALPQPGEIDYDPARESLWAAVQRIAKGKSDEAFH